jgi:RNA polymerase sigma-B factor
MASPASSLSRSALRARDSLVLEHLPLADVMARHLFPLVERDDLLQVARETLVRSVPRCRTGEPAEPYLRRCIQGALHHHLRDRVRLVRISRREHERGTCPLGHRSLDLCPAGESEESLLDQLVALAPPSLEQDALVLEQLVEQLPAGQAAALRLTVLEGLSLRAAGTQLGISHMTVQRAQQRAIAACGNSCLQGAEVPCSASAQRP